MTNYELPEFLTGMVRVWKDPGKVVVEDCKGLIKADVMLSPVDFGLSSIPLYPTPIRFAFRHSYDRMPAI